MHVGIKDGGDGVPCWNRQAVTAYVDEVNRREQQVAERNPDVVVLPGRLVCYGCEVMEFDYGVRCTATLTRTRFAVAGEEFGLTAWEPSILRGVVDASACGEVAALYKEIIGNDYTAGTVGAAA